MICLAAMLRDPYESKMVEINNSSIDGANEGLFAKKNLEVNTTVTFYNGALVKFDTDANDDDQDSSVQIITKYLSLLTCLKEL